MKKPMYQYEDENEDNKYGKTDFLGKTQSKTERNGGYQKKSMIHGHDLTSLEGNNWLTSDVINEYSDLIMNNIDDIFIFSTFFLTSLKNRGIENTEGWTRNVNIFDKSRVFFPIHENCHWYLIMLDNDDKSLECLDPYKPLSDINLPEKYKKTIEENREKKTCGA
jgi:Ulp1 family protease